jgi:hypothetical protein
MVQFTGINPAAAVEDPYGLLEGGARSLKFGTNDQYGRFVDAPVGTSYEGIICEDLRQTQITDFTTKQPVFYQDGRPAMQLVVTLQTNLADQSDPTDDGKRTLYVKNQMLAAFRTEVQKYAPNRIGIGSHIRVTLVEFKNTGKGNPQKIFQVEVLQFVPHVPVEQRQLDQAIYGGAPQAAPQVQIQPGVPAVQVPGGGVAQAQFPPQAQVPQAPQVHHVTQPVGQPIQPTQRAEQPVQQAPIAPVQPNAAAAAIAALTQPAVQPEPPAAPAAAGLTQEDLAAITQLVTQGLDPQTAAQSLAQHTGRAGDQAYIAALQAAVTAPAQA